ncbi:MAG: GrpB family protein [Rhodobiaceae bacterium]|nr:GrpB family protein [Rhodobiaceae bacterium]MCC0048392.1 GrpB family protein [Rhodobiaceae bacterium]
MEPSFELVDSHIAREKADALFERVEADLRTLLHEEVDIRHIGATAIAGCLTKGDLDIVVRVSPERFAESEAALAKRFSRNSGSVRTESFSAFEGNDCHPHLGVQLVAIGGPHDFFHVFAERLRSSPDLLQRYNALKRAYNGADMGSYRAAKDAFIERTLGKQ